MREPTLTPVESKAEYMRVTHLPWKRNEHHLELGTARSPNDRSLVLSIADLVVAREDGTLWVRSRSKNVRFHVMVALQQQLMLVTCTTFQAMPSLPHVPRITVDRLVVQRERWILDPKTIGFLELGERFERFAAARRFARDHGMPRFVFFKTPEEIKPCYLDFASPISVDAFTTKARQASSLWMSEMLPDPEGCWLTDREGRRYTSELRMVSVDPEPWRAELFRVG
jgi:hypothetical protein